MTINVSDFNTPSTSNTDGLVASTMGAFTAGMSGSSVNAPSDVDGNLNRAMQPFTLRIRDGDQWPKLGQVRFGNKNNGQTGTLSETDRIAMGQFDATLLGGFFGSDIDSASPGPDWIAREQITKEIVDAAPDQSDLPYVFTYMNQMEGGDATKIANEVGPNGTDWYFRNSSGAIVSTGFGDMINITLQVTPDADGKRYPEWYVDNTCQALLIDPHIVNGYGVGKGGINGWWDNIGVKVRKSAVDPDQNGTNNDMGDWFDADTASHMSGVDQYGAPRADAVGFVTEYRQQQRDALDKMANNNPGFVVGGNTNQWTDTPDTKIIKEYRVDTNNLASPAFVGTGMSENNTWHPSGFPRSGIWGNGDYVGAGGTYSASYNNIALISVSPGMSPPGILFAEFDVACIVNNVKGPGGLPVWDHEPDASANYDIFRMGFVMAALADAYISISGNLINSGVAGPNSGRRGATVFFEEYGLIGGSINYGWGTGSSKLFRHWMGKATQDPITLGSSAINADGSYSRTFEHCIVIGNPQTNPSVAAITIDVSALDGGPYTSIIGTQDPVVNNGADITSDFALKSADARIFPLKSWYDAL
jgi:hypothetical protein